MKQSIAKEARCFMNITREQKEQGIKQIQEAIGLIGYENFKKKAHQKIDAGSESPRQKKREHEILNELLTIIQKMGKIEQFQAKLAMLEERKEELEAYFDPNVSGTEQSLEDAIKKQEELETVYNHLRINKMIIASLERDLEVVN